MTASFYMGGLVTLADMHLEFFGALGLDSPSVVTPAQLDALLEKAQQALLEIEEDTDSDHLLDSLAWRMLADIDQLFLAAPWLACADGPVC